MSDIVGASLKWLEVNHVKLPRDLQDDLEKKGVNIPDSIKQAGSVYELVSNYSIVINQILTDYFNGGYVTGPRNHFRTAVSEYFMDTFSLGWKDGDASFPIEADAQSWLNARMSLEFGYVDMLFQQAKELRKEEGFDSVAWINDRANGYAGTLREIYNNAIVRARRQSKNVMVTFDGDDGKESCPDCQRLKGQRHRLSWFIKYNFVPPYGIGLECHKGGRCQHGLYDDNGEWVTI